MDTTKKKTNPIAIVFLVIIGIFGALQLFSRPLEGKAVTGKMEAPKEVISILENSCFPRK